MPITKNAMIRYQCLDRCFRNPGKRYYFNDLLKECNTALLEFDQSSDGIARRQLYNDINYMESSQGWNIPLERYKDGRKKYFRYSDLNFSINNQPINELEAEQIKSAMSVLGRFKGLPQFKWINEILPKLDQAFNISQTDTEIISFDNNEYLKGLEFIDPIFNSILYKKVIEIHYHSFKNPEPVIKIISPYHLKEYNNRWFIYGLDLEYDSIVNLALDRIINIKERTDLSYKESEIEFNEYFEDSLGVTFKKGDEPEIIKLKIDKSLWPYIETKPIHGSQKIVQRQNEYVEIKLELIPNYELKSQLLQYGKSLEVIEPRHLREEIKCIVKNLYDRYCE